MSIYKRGGVYWYSFIFDGQRVQRSTKVGNAKDARDIERAAWTQLARGEVGLPTEKGETDPTIGEVLDRLEADYKMRCILSQRLRSNLKKAREAFPLPTNAKELTSVQVDAYIERRQRAGKAAATINRAVGTVRLAYKKAGIVGPKFRHLSEKGNERKGFFEADEFSRLLGHLPADLKDFCRFAYATGWRKSEIASLTWADIEGDLVRLRGESSKNGDPRCVVLTPELAAIIERRRQSRISGGVLTEFIFHRQGRPIAEFRKTWAASCVLAGLGSYVCRKCHGKGTERTCEKCKVVGKYVGRIFHDFRRSGVRNMIRSGVAQSIAMKISGHKTASMFRRYDITDEADLREAMLKVETYNKAQAEKVVSIGASR